MKPSKEDFDDWKKSPVTRWVFEELELMKREYASAMSDGATLDTQSTERTAMLTAENVGFVDGLTAISKIEYRD